MGIAMLMMITMMVITTISSTNVKPRRALWERPPGLREASASRTGLAWRPAADLEVCPTLPLRIGRAIGCLVLRLRVYGEHVLSTPTGGFRVVLIAAQAPFRLAGEWVLGNGAQEADLLAVGVVGELHAFDQLVERLGVAIGADLHRAEVAGVAEILVLIDRAVNGAQIVAQLALALHPDAGARQRYGHAAEDEHDRERHDQLHQRQSPLIAPLLHMAIGRSPSCAGFHRPPAGLGNSGPTGWE